MTTNTVTVNPTYVGMNRLNTRAPIRRWSVNPTYVGMNPDQLKTTAEDKGEPHVCGDEPGTWRETPARAK